MYRNTVVLIQITIEKAWKTSHDKKNKQYTHVYLVWVKKKLFYLRTVTYLFLRAKKMFTEQQRLSPKILATFQPKWMNFISILSRTITSTIVSYLFSLFTTNILLVLGI